MPAACSRAGISRLQIEAATITPDAKPASERCTILLNDFFIKNTHAEPSAVPRKGINKPRKVSICFTILYTMYIKIISLYYLIILHCSKMHQQKHTVPQKCNKLPKHCHY